MARTVAAEWEKVGAPNAANARAVGDMEIHASSVNPPREHLLGGSLTPTPPIDVRFAHSVMSARDMEPVVFVVAERIDRVMRAKTAAAEEERAVALNVESVRNVVVVEAHVLVYPHLQQVSVLVQLRA